MRLEERLSDGTLDREIDVLREVPGDHRNLQHLQLRGHDADHVPALVQQRAAAIARLDRRGDLQLGGIVSQPGRRGDAAAREVAVAREEPVEREAEGRDILAEPDA